MKTKPIPGYVFQWKDTAKRIRSENARMVGFAQEMFDKWVEDIDSRGGDRMLHFTRYMSDHHKYMEADKAEYYAKAGEVRLSYPTDIYAKTFTGLVKRGIDAVQLSA